MRTKNPKFTEEHICPVCGQPFVKTEEHCYIAKGDYTCSWHCFLKVVKESEVIKRMKREQEVDKPKRGRPRKNEC